MTINAIWMAYDLGIGGDYTSLYRWLANNNAIECGDGVAYIKYKVNNDGDLITQLKKEIAEMVSIDNKTRIYCVRKEHGKIKGSFIFGSRKGNPWEGFGDMNRGIEDGE